MTVINIDLETSVNDNQKNWVMRNENKKENSVYRGDLQSRAKSIISSKMD